VLADQHVCIFAIKNMNTFNKEERLCSRKLLDLLFKDGSSFLLYPFRVSYMVVDVPHSFPAQVVINVSKKRFKKATDRNLIKRRSREAYRLLKGGLLYPHLSSLPGLMIFSLQFIGKKKYEFDFMEKKMALALKKLQESLVKDENH